MTKNGDIEGRSGLSFFLHLVPNLIHFCVFLSTQLDTVFRVSIWVRLVKDTSIVWQDKMNEILSYSVLNRHWSSDRISFVPRLAVVFLSFFIAREMNIDVLVDPMINSGVIVQDRPLNCSDGNDFVWFWLFQFILERFDQFGEIETIISTGPLPITSSPNSSFSFFSPYRCNRSLGILLTTNHRSVVYFSPPQYYGHKCQFHAARLSVVLLRL